MTFKIYAFICTRSKDYSETSKSLFSYLSSIGAEVITLINQNSIFEAYSKAFKSVNAQPNDVIIMCHDDIEILSSFPVFRSIMLKTSTQPDIGFVGAAGTYKFTRECVWWDHKIWQEGKHRGYIFHGKKAGEGATYYGPPGKVIVLDGLFLAAKAEVINKVGLDKPSYFPGNWDFYDIHSTFKAFELGLNNYVAPLILRHESGGKLVGRDSWHMNRLAFIQNTMMRYPLVMELKNEDY